MWSHDVVATSIGLAGDLKLGQYLKVSVVSSGTPMAEVLILSRIDSSPSHVSISDLGNYYWYVPRSMLMFGNLILYIPRGFCELWCVLWGALPEFQG